MIRPADPADAPAVRALQLHLPEPAPELLSHGLRAGDVLVSTTSAGDRPVGYLLAVRADPDAHVAELAVAPARRREGRARALLERLLADVSGRTTLTVAPGNAAARSLYRSCGFSLTERIDEQFGTEPGLLYARE